MIQRSTALCLFFLFLHLILLCALQTCNYLWLQVCGYHTQARYPRVNIGRKYITDCNINYLRLRIREDDLRHCKDKNISLSTKIARANR